MEIRPNEKRKWSEKKIGDDQHSSTNLDETKTKTKIDSICINVLKISLVFFLNQLNLKISFVVRRSSSSKRRNENDKTTKRKENFFKLDFSADVDMPPSKIVENSFFFSSFSLIRIDFWFVQVVTTMMIYSIGFRLKSKGQSTMKFKKVRRKFHFESFAFSLSFSRFDFNDRI